MKKIKFTKMQGAGNDFVVMEVLKTNFKKLAIKVCNRKTGVGADGLLVLDKSKKADYRMRIINADGSEAEMCGNGARCMAAFIVQNRRPKKTLFSIETMSGNLLAQAKGQVAKVRLSEPQGYKPNIPIKIGKRTIQVNYIDTGVPHAIIFVSDLAKIDVSGIGRFIRFHNKFKPRGTNVDFVEQVKQNLVNVRTYERGVEDETLACGTGSVACAIITFLKANPLILSRDHVSMNVRTSGGELLNIQFSLKNRKIENVWLKGPVQFIAKGEYHVK
ncbi:MAG: diaminopimelate epimerase [Candidatus Omnitrophota bacterium]